MDNEKQRSILVVNSEPDIADLFAEMLLMDANDYIITTTFSGNGCISSIKKNKPGLVLMDMELPDVDGWELIKNIKDTNPDTTVVIITSKKPDISDMPRLSMVSDYLIKPVTLDGLLMAVKDAFEIPALLKQCLETIEDCEDYRDMLYPLYQSLKQNILDRKCFILMRQLYPDRTLEHDPESRKQLQYMKEKINLAQKKLDYFKDKNSILA